ncbi:MAG TPA: response regulator [Thermoanaerobaculia bacterium]|nr:response regulator [Thermoanaerobaculia bacterium]
MFRSPAAPPLLLLVDDDPYQAEVASYIAYELGCDFESALSGTEALEKVEARRPDVVLLDVRMPDLSGYEVCRRIKTVGATAGTQVIFVTARTEEEDLLQGFEALANDYVTKPFSARELKARVKNALRIKELLDALTARTQILELQQEISEKVEEDGVTNEDFRARLLVPILDRISSVFGADGVTLHVRRPGHVELFTAASTAWPAGGPPEFIATLGLEEDPRTGRAPRLPGEARDPGPDWAITAAPVFGGRELLGTLRLYRRGPLPPPGESPELEHLIAFSAHLGRTLHRIHLVDELRTKAGA